MPTRLKSHDYALAGPVGQSDCFAMHTTAVPANRNLAVWAALEGLEEEVWRLTRRGSSLGRIITSVGMALTIQESTIFYGTSPLGLCLYEVLVGIS